MAGPVIIFDKSALQALSLDEAVWLDNFYLSNITPLFYVETLADLEKEVKAGKTPEQVVGEIARKTPVSGSHPNVHHLRLALSDLLGHPIDVSGRPLVPGGVPVSLPDGNGVVFRPSPEALALERWQEWRFLEVEREYAKRWRAGLAGLDLESAYALYRRLFKQRGRVPKDLMEARRFAEELLDDPSKREDAIVLACDTLGLPEALRQRIRDRWEGSGRPPLSVFAPYARHILLIDFFFHVALGADLISRERPSNRVDVAYLYYLPFCKVFTSRDNLHKRVVPVFLGADQTFLDGSELKGDLAKLDAHYSGLPEEVRERGVISFAPFPPEDDAFLTTRLWDKDLPKWRESLRARPDAEAKERVMVRIREAWDKAKRGETVGQVSSEPDFLLIERRVRPRMGKWRLVPPEAEREWMRAEQQP